MANTRKVIKVGTSLAFIIPQVVVRDLYIRRGDLFDLAVTDWDTMVFRRVVTVTAGSIGQIETPNLPKIHYEK